MRKYTPGPWSISGVANVRKIFRGTDSSSYHIATVQLDKHDQLHDVDANAQLICAAPDLLEACYMALSCMAPEDNDVTAQKLRKAIKKAGGQES